MSRRVWKRSPSPVGFVSPGWCTTTSATNSLIGSTTSASRASRTSLVLSGSISCTPRPFSRCRGQARQPHRQPVVAPRLSIVVLPFSNLSDDQGQQYFADGITEDLTTDLSRLAGMLVISRNTAFTYQNKRVDTRQIGRELCVRYVLE